MNPAPEPIEQPPVRQLVRATVQTPRFRWVFPAVEGLEANVVRAEIRTRLAGSPYATVADDANTVITYPDGVYTAHMTPDAPPPLGWVGPWNPQPTPTPAPQPSDNGTTPTARDLGPLPEVHPRESAAQRAYGDLQALLNQWASHHQVSSAEYFMHLSRALQFHAGQLVMRERRPR